MAGSEPTVDDDRAARAERSAVLRRMTSVRARLRAANARVAELEAERTEVYRAARQLDPPVTYRYLADHFGVTEAAIMQKLKRDDRRTAAAAAAKKGRKRRSDGDG